MVRTDGQGSVTAVNQNCQAHGFGPANIGQGVQGCADCAPGEQNVVDEDDGFPVDSAAGKVGGFGSAQFSCFEVVPVHGDVQASHDFWDVNAWFNLPDAFC